ncbi:MAG: hypothetical protein ACKVS9_13140 [Phycisphaerae bacterium]
MHRQRGFDIKSAIVGATLALAVFWGRELARPTAAARADSSLPGEQSRELTRLVDQTNQKLAEAVAVLKHIRDQQHGPPGFEPNRRK